MSTVILVIHVITCVFLIIFVLIQAGKGADAGATFGGGLGQTYFGSQGGNILTKITTFLAIIFMLTSISLTVIYHQKVSKSVVSDLKLDDQDKTTTPNTDEVKKEVKTETKEKTN